MTQRFMMTLQHTSAGRHDSRESKLGWAHDRSRAALKTPPKNNSEKESLTDQIKRVSDSIQRRGREHWWIKPEINDAFEQRGLRIQPDHFHSPLPSLDVIKGFDWSKEVFPLDRLNFNRGMWKELLRDIRTYTPELLSCSFPELGLERFPWDNVMYRGLDALALYAFVRRFKPQRIIEIGSGYSTHIALAALTENGTGSMTCVEPYPSPTLEKLGNRVAIEVALAQSIDLSRFERLEPNDIVFIDSSHVAAFQSDVNFEIFEIFPLLPAGVLVHVHDIFFPYEYPREWVLERRWYWNEQYLLYAFLLENPRYEVIFPTVYSLRKAEDEVRRNLPTGAPSSLDSAAIWLRRC